MNLQNYIFRLGVLTGLFVLVAGMGSATDLTNIGTIYPEGTTLTVEGDLNLSGNSLVDVSTSDRFVDRDGDYMTGSLSMSNNAITDIDWTNSDNPNTDSQSLSISGDTISLDNGGSVTIQDDTIPDDQNLGSSRSGDTVTISIDNGNGASFTDNYEANTDNQDLSNVVGNGGALSSGQTIDASSGVLIIPTSPP